MRRNFGQDGESCIAPRVAVDSREDRGGDRPVGDQSVRWVDNVSLGLSRGDESARACFCHHGHGFQI